MQIQSTFIPYNQPNFNESFKKKCLKFLLFHKFVRYIPWTKVFRKNGFGLNIVEVEVVWTSYYGNYAKVNSSAFVE